MLINNLKPLLQILTIKPAVKFPIRTFLLRRAIMYVPADDRKKIDKSFKLDVDSIVLDCEDGVALNRKSTARINIRRLLDGGKPKRARSYDLAIRVNGMDAESYLNDDISLLLSGEHLPNTIVLPKVETVAHLKLFAELLNKHIKVEDAKVHLVMGIESALAFVNLEAICRGALETAKSSKFLPSGVFFGSDDFCASIGATRSESSKEVLYARQKLIVYAKAFNFQAIDMVYLKYKDLEGLKKQCMEGVELGFTGKQAIHPDQVPVVQTAYLPNEEKIKWARHLITAFNKHQESGEGAFVYEGQMIDMPTMKQAQNILDLANSIMIREPKKRR